MSPRGRAVLLAYTEAVVAPADGLPAVADTDALDWFDECLRRAPRLNRWGLRALIALIERAPGRRRFTALAPGERAAVLARLDRGPLAPGLRALQGLAQMAYYGDLAVLRASGYDPEAVVARARGLRLAEQRW